MRKIYLVLSVVLLQGCAFQHNVQQIGVGYNNAVANLSNELTLQNIARAETNQPLHYMGFSRLSGSLVFTGSGGFNAAVHDPTRTVTTTNENDLAGQTTTTKGIMSNASGTNASMSNETDITNPVTTAKNTVASALASGGNIYTPSIQAQVQTGPSFDMELLDTQAFYQGVMGEIPAATYSALMDQGFDPELLQALLIERIDFTAKDETTLPDSVLAKVKSAHPRDFIKTIPKGALVQSLVNDPETDEGALFMSNLCAFQLSTASSQPKRLMPLSKAGGPKGEFALKDVAGLDGKALDLDKDVEKTTNLDDVEVIRPSTARAFTFLGRKCDLVTGALVAQGFQHRPVALSRAVLQVLPDYESDTLGRQFAPQKVPYPELVGSFSPSDATGSQNPSAKDHSNGVTIGTADVQFSNVSAANHADYPVLDDKGVVWVVPCNVNIILRSPEGVIRYLGAYLRAAKAKGTPSEVTDKFGTPPGQPPAASAGRSRPPTKSAICR